MLTEQEIHEMVMSGKSAFTFDNTGDYNRAVQALGDAQKMFHHKQPGHARFWPIFTLAGGVENALDCKLCEGKTQNVFNIGFQAMPVCEACAASITLQQVKFYVMGGS